MSLLIGFAKREIKKSVIRKFIFSIIDFPYTETVTVVTILLSMPCILRVRFYFYRLRGFFLNPLTRGLKNDIRSKYN